LISLQDIPNYMIWSIAPFCTGDHIIQNIQPANEVQNFSYSEIKASFDPFMAIAHRSPPVQKIFQTALHSLSELKPSTDSYLHLPGRSQTMASKWSPLNKVGSPKTKVTQHCSICGSPGQRKNKRHHKPLLKDQKLITESPITTDENKWKLRF
jgi:hypothetical protein